MQPPSVDEQDFSEDEEDFVQDVDTVRDEIEQMKANTAELENVAAHFKNAAVSATEKTIETEKDYLIRAFKNVAYHINKVAQSFVDFIEMQEYELSALDVELNISATRLLTTHDAIGAAGFKCNEAQREYVKDSNAFVVPFSTGEHSEKHSSSRTRSSRTLRRTERSHLGRDREKGSSSTSSSIPPPPPPDASSAPPSSSDDAPPPPPPSSVTATVTARPSLQERGRAAIPPPQDSGRSAMPPPPQDSGRSAMPPPPQDAGRSAMPPPPPIDDAVPPPPMSGNPALPPRHAAQPPPPPI